MEISIADQIALDDALVAPANRLKIGTIPPKTKGSKKKADTDTTTKQKPPTIPKDKKEKKSGKGKQKAKELETISEAVLTEAEQLKIITKRSRKETHSSHASDDDISWKSSDDDQEDDKINDDKKAQDDEDKDKNDDNKTTQNDEDDDMHDDDENAQDDESPAHQEFETKLSMNEQAEEIHHLPQDWFQQPIRLPSPDHAWNKSVPVVHESVQPWLSNLTRRQDPRESFDELTDITFDFSAFMIVKYDKFALLGNLTLGPKIDDRRMHLRPQGSLGYDILYKFKEASSTDFGSKTLKTCSLSSTLDDVRTALNDRLKGIRMEYLPQTFWSQRDKANARAMIQEIDTKD
ncbi:hypothetical protein Tco_0813825 [Tanacetum coccineum]